MPSADSPPGSIPSAADRSATAPPEDGRRDPARARVRAYYELTKPGIAGFVMMTAGVSYYVASAGTAQLLPVVHTLLGTLMATAGALALNQYLEREVDALMVRTRRRPVPSGRLAPRDALLFGASLVAIGCTYLWVTVGWLPAILTLASAAAYNLVYTPLKTRSYMATLAGAVPGAMPALIGWSAATGSVSLGGLVLFTIAFLWQLPHVLALAWLLREDYVRAGFLLTPPADPEGRVIARQMNLYTAVLLPVSLLPTLMQLTGWIYFFGAILLGGLLLVWTARAGSRMEQKDVRRVFLGSLAYQPLLLGLMLLDTVPGPAPLL
jgi:heme o synthase